jgi:UDP-3-O-[3-hydroxymyristoyl] glucosamine N-acyltransferase
MLGTLDQLAARVGGRVIGDGSVSVAGVSTVAEATPGALTFATSETYLSDALAGPAAAILVEAALVRDEAAKPLLVVENVRHALAHLLKTLQVPRPRGPYRHPTAVIEPDARVAGDVHIGAHAYIGNRVSIGGGSVVGPGVYIGEGASIGESCWIHPNVTLASGCAIGNRVVLYSGCVIGSDGFGWAFVDGRAERIPQIGNVVLEDDVEVGANTCIDRAQVGSTHVGWGTKIDNLVQIGHNCRIGKHCVIAALTGLAGSTVLGDNVKVGGQVGFRGHMTVGSGATIAGGTGVWGNVAEGATVSGSPAQDHRAELHKQVMIRRLPKLFDRVETLERSRRNE